MKGRLITLEGTEGCGKSTQARILVERLERAGVEVVFLREPGGTATGERLRDILQHGATGEPIGPETELLLFVASRAHLVRQVMQPALACGQWVLCDRFADSTTAYQGYGRGFDLETVERINRFATAGMTPDVTFLLHLDIVTGMQRVRRRQEAGGGVEDRFERESTAFHERILRGYEALAAREPGRFCVLDARLEVEILAARIWERVEPWIGGGCSS